MPYFDTGLKMQSWRRCEDVSSQRGFDAKRCSRNGRLSTLVPRIETSFLEASAFLSFSRVSRTYRNPLEWTMAGLNQYEINVTCRVVTSSEWCANDPVLGRRGERARAAACVFLGCRRASCALPTLRSHRCTVTWCCYSRALTTAAACQTCGFGPLGVVAFDNVPERSPGTLHEVSFGADILGVNAGSAEYRDNRVNPGPLAPSVRIDVHSSQRRSPVVRTPNWR